MFFRPSQKIASCRKPGALVFLLQTTIVVAALAVTAQAQRPGVSQPARDMVRSAGIKEMDRLLLYKPILAPKEDPVRKAALLKQISEDFKLLQSLNNRMMAEAWSRPELDYNFISDMVSQIKGKAARLKQNLGLPKPQDDQPKQPEVSFADAEKFRAALMQLDGHITSFATNPLFQTREVMQIDLANRATRDLSAVIELSAKLKGNASKLAKVAKTSP